MTVTMHAHLRRPRRSAWPMAARCSLLALALTATAADVDAQETLRRGTSNEQLIDDRLRKAVADGHDWLAQHQHQDGYWSELVGYKLNTNYRNQSTTGRCRTSASHRLALMSFLAGGHLPDRGKYGEVLDRGLDFVLQRSAQDDGQIHAARHPHVQPCVRDAVPRRGLRHGRA